MKKEKERMGMRRKGCAFLSMLLVCLMIASPLCGAVEAAGGAATERSAESLDFSAALSKKSELPAGALLERLLASMGREETVSEAEIAHLNKYFDQKFFYSAILSGELVKVETDPELVTVTATPYTVQGQNGKNVLWSPVYATYGDEREDFEGGATVSFPREEDSDYSVEVTYQGTVELSAETVNLILNYAYADKAEAELASAVLADYQVKYALWQANKTAWTDYDHAYADYLLDMAEYESEHARWEKNQAEWVTYANTLAEYQRISALWMSYDRKYSDYEIEYDEYLTENNAYQAIEENQNAIRAAMAAMESIYVKPEKTNSLYKALQNAEIVRMLEKYQSVLTTTFGISKQEIKAMRESSDRLNELLAQYAEKREISEQAAFTFYKANYAEINQRFNTLYDKMCAILTPTIYNFMCGKLELEYEKEEATYKKWRIKTVLSHVYLVCQGLDDNDTASETWSFFNDMGDPHTYYFSDFLDQKLILPDDNKADPTNLSWQTLPEKEPTAPTAPKAPSEPRPESEPDKPAAKWNEPTAPTAPTAPTERLTEPTAPPAGTAETIKRAEGLAAVALTRRDEVTEAQKLLLPTVMLKATASDVPIVYDVHGNPTDMDPYDLPDTLAPYEDETHTYAFCCWSSSPTEEKAITSETRHIYPIYTPTAKRHDVTFVVNGVEYVRNFAHGESPVFDGSLAKPSDEQYDYTFSEWNPPLAPVTQPNMRFEAVYTESLRSYEICFRLGDREIRKEFLYGTTPICPARVNSYVIGNVAYEFTGEWNPPLSTVRGDATYEAVYDPCVLVTLPDGVSGTLQVTEHNSYFSVSGSGESMSVGALMEYAAGKGKQVEVIFADNGISIIFDADSVQSIQTENGVHLTLDRGTETEGESLSLRLTDENGTVLNASGSIRMSYSVSEEDTGRIVITAEYADGLKQTVPYQLSAGVMEFWANVNATYRISKTYTLTVTESENGAVEANKQKYFAGEKIGLTFFANAEYRVGAILVKNLATGEVTSYTDADALVMPAYDAELTVEFLPVTYTVEFVYHGGSTKDTYTRGKMPTVPKIEASYEEDGYFYTFIGWSSAVTKVTGDAVYTAKYYSVPVEEKSGDGEGGATRRMIETLLPFAIGGVLLLAAAIVVPVVVVKKSKKKKQRIQKESAADEKEKE